MSMVLALPTPTRTMNRRTTVMIKDSSLRLRIRLANCFPLPASRLMVLLERRLRLHQSRFQHIRGGVRQHHHPWSRRESQALLRQHGMLRDSRPEALNFPSQTYEMSQDPAPFVPPNDTRVPQEICDLAEPEAEESSSTPTGEQAASSVSRAPAEPSLIGSSTTGQKSEPSTPATPTIKVSPSDPWTTFTRTNAWDEVPEIERYVEGLQKHRRGKSQGSVGLSGEKAAKEHGLKLTDFPSVVERPSLPVTPAPIRRPKFWGGGPGPGDGDDEEELPVAHGVPPQSDWLQKLAKQQSEALLKKLGGGEGGPEGVSREIPTRSLPFGSEGVISPTYVAQSSGGVVLSPQPVKGSATTSALRSLSGDQASSTTTAIPAPAYQGPGTAWERGEGAPLRETPALPTEEERDVLDT
ncbi:glycosyl transferase family 8 protein [Colletotrichum tofieldiae]|nr:glycosyl transferase family 8 protein [Colletotrichum tofieldiae]